MALQSESYPEAKLTGLRGVVVVYMPKAALAPEALQGFPEVSLVQEAEATTPVPVGRVGQVAMVCVG